MHELCELAVNRSLITPDQAAQCEELARTDHLPVAQALVKGGFVEEEQALALLAGYLNLRYAPDPAAEGMAVSDRFIQRVPLDFARTYNLVGLQSGERLCIATSNPIEQHALDDVLDMLGCEAEVVVTPPGRIADLITEGYREDVTQRGEAAIHDIRDEEAATAGGADLLDVSDQPPVIRLVNHILLKAVNAGASDIHVQPYEDRMQVRYRIDGILHDTITPPKRMQDEITSRIKVMGGMDIAEKRLPQDGRLTVRIGRNEIDLRISSVPTSFGERIVLRLLDKSKKLYTLEELGMDEYIRRHLLRLVNFSHGIVLVTGPTGSGKSTTLYATLNRIDSTERNIITVEDPIEYHLDGISQIQVERKKGLTFASGLRSILRQDPDVIMVGEIRDLETATMSIQAAQTGHLVFSTLHTNDSAGAITRLLDLGIEPYLVASSLVAVLAQRLVRVNCPACREAADSEPAVLEEIGLDPKAAHGKIHRGRGCERCMQTGYSGRTGLFELLMNNDIVHRQIVERASAADVKRAAVENGVTTLRMDGVQKILTGGTTPEEVLRVTQMDLL
ncbi:MAG: ATPase, T2SS/T4P/T4SS family [Planctomycetota bacterium]